LIGSIGGLEADVMMELHETSYSVMISTAKEKSKRGEEFDFLDAEFLE
jgi:hypothetical protein